MLLAAKTKNKNWNWYPFLQVIRKRKTKYEVQNRFSKLGRKWKTKSKIQICFSMSCENEKWKWHLNSLFPCHRNTVGTKVHAFVWLGNLDLDFKIWILDLQSNAKSEIRKRISTLRYLFLDFHFHHSIGKSEKGFEKLSLRTVVLHAHAYLAKRRPCFTRIVLQILFWISQSNG